MTPSTQKTPHGSNAANKSQTPSQTPTKYTNPTLDPFFQNSMRWNTFNGRNKLTDQELSAILWMAKYGPDKTNQTRADWVRLEREKRGLSMPAMSTHESKTIMLTRPWKNGLKEYAKRHYNDDTSNLNHFGFHWNDQFIDLRLKTPEMFDLRGILLDTHLFFWEKVEWSATKEGYKVSGAGKNESKEKHKFDALVTSD